MIKKNRFGRAALLVALVSQVGVGLADDKASGQNAAPVVLPKAPSPARLVFADKCQQAIVPGHNESPAALLLFAPLLQLIGSKAAGAVVGYGIDKTSEWLKSQKANLTASTTAMFSTGFYDSNVSGLGFKCVEFVRGSLREQDFNDSVYEASIKEINVNGNIPSVWTKDKLSENWAKYRLSSLPELYIAFRIELVGMPIPGKPGKDGATQFKVVPLEAYYLKSGAKRNDGNEKKVTARVMISAVTDGGMKPIYDHLFDFGKLSFGRTTNLDTEDGPLAPLPAPIAVAATPAASTPAATPTKEGAKSKSGNTAMPPTATPAATPVYSSVPVTFTVVVNELEDGGDFAGAIAAAAFDDEAKKKATDTTQKAVSDLLGKALGIPDAGAAPAK